MENNSRRVRLLFFMTEDDIIQNYKILPQAE
jgi:hypothetical protein